jgi:hypothetical protein
MSARMRVQPPLAVVSVIVAVTILGVMLGHGVEIPSLDAALSALDAPRYELVELTVSRLEQSGAVAGSADEPVRMGPGAAASTGWQAGDWVYQVVLREGEAGALAGYHLEPQLFRDGHPVGTLYVRGSDSAAPASQVALSWSLGPELGPASQLTLRIL